MSNSKPRLVFVGAKGDGKSSLISAINAKPFVEKYSPTKEVARYEFNENEIWEVSSSQGQSTVNDNLSIPNSKAFFYCVQARSIIENNAEIANQIIPSIDVRINIANKFRNLTQPEPFLVITKIDDISSDELTYLKKLLDEQVPFSCVLTSAKKGDGIDILRDKIVNAKVDSRPQSFQDEVIYDKPSSNNFYFKCLCGILGVGFIVLGYLMLPQVGIILSHWAGNSISYSIAAGSTLFGLACVAYTFRNGSNEGNTPAKKLF